jgi:nucleotide-binding universal stress UspA family protein
MYTHILIATDGSELAGKALRAGLQLAKQLGAQATVVTVSEPWRGLAMGEPAIAFPFEEIEKEAAEAAARILAEASAAAAKQGVACTPINAKGFAAEAIIDTAKARACDLIVMSSHGRRGLAKALLGSQAMRVVTLSEVPVLICR